MKARLEKLEKQLHAVVDTSARAHAEANSASGHDAYRFDPGPKVPQWKFDPVEPKLYYGPSDQGLYLPPLDVS